MIVSLIGNAFPPMVALVTAPILASGLGVDGRGQVAAATAPFILLLTLGAFGVPEAVTYTVARTPTVFRRITLVGCLFSGTVGVGLVVLIALLSSWLSGNDASTAHLIELASLALAPALCIGVIRGTASGLNLWTLVAAERFITSAVRLIAVGALAIFRELTPFSATLSLALSPLAGGLAYLRLQRLSRSVMRPQTNSGSLASISRYASKVWIGAMAGILLVRLDQTIMLPLTNAYQLGLYVVAVAVAEVPLVVNGAVRDVTFASEASGQSMPRLAAASRLSGSLSGAVCLVMGAIVPSALPVLFGRQFAEAVPATLLLLGSVAVVSQGSVVAAAISGRGHPGIRSGTLLVACFVNVAVILVLVPTHGATGAAWATLVGNLVFTVGSLWWLRRLYEVRLRDLFGLRKSDWQLVRRQLSRGKSRYNSSGD